MKYFSFVFMHCGFALALVFVSIEYGTSLTNTVAQNALSESYNELVNENITENSIESDLDESLFSSLDSTGSVNVEDIKNEDSLKVDEILDVIDNSETIAELQSEINELLPELDITVEQLELLPVEYGTPVARIVIPSIDVDEILVYGVEISDLREGPGIFPGSPAPGGVGNLSIAGHRTTYGSPFGDLDLLNDGDIIEIYDEFGWKHVYEIDIQESGKGHFIVSPFDIWVTYDNGDESTITLLACHPKRSAAQRIIVTGTLVSSVNVKAEYESSVANINSQRETENVLLAEEQRIVEERQKQVNEIIASLRLKIEELKVEQLPIVSEQLTDNMVTDVLDEINTENNVEILESNLVDVDIVEELVDDTIDWKSLIIFSGSSVVLWLAGVFLHESRNRFLGGVIYGQGFLVWGFVGFPLAAFFGI